MTTSSVYLFEDYLESKLTDFDKKPTFWERIYTGAAALKMVKIGEEGVSCGSVHK